jgi:CHAT domain-containing protein
MTSRSDPLRPVILFGLGIGRYEQHILSNQREDLDNSISHLTESVLLLPRAWLEHGPMILQALFFLASTLLKRSKLSNLPEDASYAAKYLRYLRDQPHQVFELVHEVTALLVETLNFQVKLEVGNAMQNIGEMAVLCRELFTLDMSDVDITLPITYFAEAVLSKIYPFVPDQPLDQVIECLRAARKHKPELREARLALAKSLAFHYFMTFVNDYYEEAASVLDEIIASSSPEDSQDEIVPHAQIVNYAQHLFAFLATTRANTHQTPEYLEEAMYRTRRAFLATSPELPQAVGYDLERTAKLRFSHFGSIKGFEEWSGNLPLSPDPVVSDDNLDRVVEKAGLLEELRSGIRNNDITTFDEAIEKGRTILASADPRHPLASGLLDLFCDILNEVFKRTNKIEYLNESISTRRQVFDCPSAEILRFKTLYSLSYALLARFRSFPGHRTQDLDEGLELLSKCVNDGQASSPNRFLVACKWADVARRTRHPSVSKAYESAVSLMQDTLLFAPTLQLQHATLARSHKFHRIPLAYASYWVSLHRLEEAIETLESGRALLWAEMRHFRTSIDQLLQADPQLGHKFAEVNRDLEELTKSIPPSHKLSMDHGPADGLKAVDPFGRLLLKQRNLLKERDNLISQIQALPGFDSFLTSPSFGTLRSAASCGPVIIINHSIWRSDILILLHNASPSLIPTPADFYRRASTLKDKLLDSRHEYGPDSSHYEESLASALAELYILVGKPVIDRLRQLQVPEQSRIWWCPTSVFCSLPLHAMGPIQSDEGEIRYFLDLYICSYTPTLSALIQSRNRDIGSRSSGRPSLLLVAQPDPTLPTVEGEIQVVRALDTEVTSLISGAATPATVIDGFRHHRFVHFACHGTLEDGKPFEAGFELHGGERLTLLEIVRSHLPTAELAFLSACHTAEVTEGSAADEGLHLAAAVQYCGFRSVVGTMWAMVDEDGRDLAEYFYKALFSTPRREEGIPYHERSAKALRFAVKKLRRKRWITLERWVNFVHYGA